MVFQRHAANPRSRGQPGIIVTIRLRLCPKKAAAENRKKLRAYHSVSSWEFVA
jgi:hypothetical protein